MKSIKLAVVGHPVAHSQSPEIHAKFGEQAGISVQYDKIDVEPGKLAEAVETLRGQGYAGLNVTVPHKLAACGLADVLSPAAELAESVNTLTLGDTVRGDNTDGVGFMRDLASKGVDIAGKNVVVLGAGGSTRGIVGPLLDAKPKQLVVAGRNPYNAEAIGERFGPNGPFSATRAPAVPLLPCTYLALKGIHADALIHASPAGHYRAMPKLPADLLVPGAPCYDLSYGEAHAVFKQWAEAHGAGTVYDGLGMLHAQAAASFEIWTGFAPNL